MCDIHSDLKQLAPIDWADVPLDDLKTFAKQVLSAGEALCETIPPPADGDDFESSKPTASQPDAARCADDLINSSARPQEPDADLTKLRKSWGKAIKISQEENPLGLTLYKMAGKDRHGAWFARHSIIEGLSYARFRKALQEEFATSMAVQEGPGSGAVRGLGADRQIEHHDIEGVGKLEVYQNSAQFPGPTSPREFVPLVVSAETSKATGLPQGRAPAQQYLIVSKPVTHPEVPARSDWIRGGYESVEMIREIPLDVPSSARPVQWIQISRSDPGGSIPRFMVERGTPAAVCADAKKFLEWACSTTAKGSSSGDVVVHSRRSSTSPRKPSTSTQSSATPTASEKGSHHSHSAASKAKSVERPQHAGIAFHLTNALEAGLDQYAPAIVADYAKAYIQNGNGQHMSNYESDTTESSASASSSRTSFESADEHIAIPAESTDSLPTSQAANSQSDETIDNKHGREAQKLSREEQKVHEKLERKSRHLAKKSQERKDKDKSDAQRIQEKHNKELRKAREKHDKEVKKLQAKRDKEVERARHKRDKQVHADILDRLVQERDAFRDMCDRLNRENQSLKAQLSEVQTGKRDSVDIPEVTPSKESLAGDKQ